MNYRIITRFAALAAVCVLAACAARTDCSSALETASEAARDQQPPGAWIGQVGAACIDTAMETWGDSLARTCAPVYAFHAASSDGRKPAECTDAGFESAWNLGEMVSGMQREAAEIERRLNDDSLASATRRALERRLIVIGRDLPQVEALARMEGYLPPAGIPGQE